MEAGRQSPPPDRQSGAQQQDPPASGHALEKGKDEKDAKAQLDKLASNPKGPMDDALESKFSKTEH